MALIADLEMYARFARGLYGYYRHILTLEEARRIVHERMERREAGFLRLTERAVYGFPRSPYYALLKRAGCELGDLQAKVKRDGLEAALLALREEGVFVTFEEFKGRVPIVRNGLVLKVTADDFENPFLARHYYSETGGSTGPASRIGHDLDHAAALSPHHLLAREAHGVSHSTFALWRGILPDGSGINNILWSAPAGQFPKKWFSHLPLKNSRNSLKYGFASYYFVFMSKLSGASIPLPQFVPLDQAIVIARWAADAVRQDGSCLIATQVSRALRVCLAAREAGVDLTGAVFMVAGEPSTPAKVREIGLSGARCFPTYGMAEVGRIGMGCPNPAGCDDVHLLKDAFALISHPHQVHGLNLSVPAFNITTLLPTTPRLLLNVEIDDYGLVSDRSCGCDLEACGYTTHLEEIRSYGKLTGEGVTLAGSEMLHIIEDVLPGRFGGSPLDYQLLEEEDTEGFTRLSLVISPRVSIPDERTVVESVMQALAESSGSAAVAQTVWQQAGTLQVKRIEPVWTARGKLMPLQIQRKRPDRTTHL